MVQRRKSVSVKVGSRVLGANSPVLVQSMTNTETSDVDATVNQVVDLADAGSEIVRVTVNTEDAARAVPVIVEKLRSLGRDTPIVGDFHYNGHLLLKKFPACARALDKYRINPGNSDIGKEVKNNFASMVEVALENDKPIRIGANWGSLDKVVLARLMDENQKKAQPLKSEEVMLEAVITSALESAAYAERLGLSKDKIVLSAKVSEVPSVISVYQNLAQRCDYALHIGLTEAGLGHKGTVSSSLALGLLLWQGIGDTIRVSITPTPGASRTEEVLICQQILQSLGLRTFFPQVTSCPGCGRTSSDLFQKMAEDIQGYLKKQMTQWKDTNPGASSMNVAVMGCIVNGPGESRHANLGISLPGNAEDPKAPVYKDGQLIKTLQGPTIVPEFIDMIKDYVETHYPKKEIHNG